MSRITQVRIALAGYSHGDRVSVYRDTKSHLGIFKDRFGCYPLRCPQVGVILEGPLSEDRFPVLFDGAPRGARPEGYWWVHPDDMRPE